MIETRKGPRRALVLTPEADIRVGRERLLALRTGGASGEIDQVLADRVRFSKVHYDVVVFRGKTEDGAASYRLDDQLEREQLEELALRLVASQLSCWRSLLELGVSLIVHSDFGSSAKPFRDACRSLADTPDRDSGVGARVANIDEWLLRHLIFYFSQSYEATMSTLLPDKLPLLELRKEKLELFGQILREESW